MNGRTDPTVCEVDYHDENHLEFLMFFFKVQLMGTLSTTDWLGRINRNGEPSMMQDIIFEQVAYVQMIYTTW